MTGSRTVPCTPLLSTSFTRQRCIRTPCAGAGNATASNTRCVACVLRPTVSCSLIRTSRKLALLGGQMPGRVKLAIATFLHSSKDTRDRSDRQIADLRCQFVAAADEQQSAQTRIAALQEWNIPLVPYRFDLPIQYCRIFAGPVVVNRATRMFRSPAGNGVSQSDSLYV